MFFVPFSLERRNSIASIVPIELNIFLKTFIFNKSSFLKSYEEEYGCPVYSSMNDKKGKYKIMSLLQRKYNIYSVFHERWGGWITIPIYSAELHPQNKSKIVMKQWEGLEKALAAESKGFRLQRVVIEVLNPYDNIVLLPEISIPDIATKFIIAFEINPIVSTC